MQSTTRMNLFFPLLLYTWSNFQQIFLSLCGLVSQGADHQEFLRKALNIDPTAWMALFFMAAYEGDAGKKREALCLLLNLVNVCPHLAEANHSERFWKKKGKDKNSQDFILELLNFAEIICDIPPDQILTRKSIEWFNPEVEKEKRFFLL